MRKTAIVVLWCATSVAGCSGGGPESPPSGAQSPRPPAASAPQGTTTPPPSGNATTDAPADEAADDDDAEQDASPPSESDAGVADAGPPSWESEIVSTTPFGCTVRAVERDVLMRGPERNAGFRAWADRARRWALVPAPVATTLSRPAAVYLVTSAGLCRATVGSPVLGGIADRPILGSRVGGCARGVAPFAFVCDAGVRLPRGPRWTTLDGNRVRRLGATGPTGDVLADRSFRAFGVLIPQTSRRAFRAARDRGTSMRRVSVRSLDLPGDNLRVVDLGWAFFDEEDDPRSACPRVELLASALYLRSRTAPTGDAGPADAWQRCGAFRGATGVIHDGSRLLAVVSSSTASGGACWGAESCREVVLHPRTDAARLKRGARAPFGFSAGELTDRSPLSIGRTRNCEP